MRAQREKLFFININLRDARRHSISAFRVVRWALIGGMVLAALASVEGQDNSSGDDFRSLLQRGFAMHQQENYAGALPLLERAWKLEPHDYFANLLVGIDLLRTDRAADAISYLKEAARQRPKEDFPYEYLGEAQAHLQHYAEASTSYERALAIAPNSPQAIEGAVGFWLERFRELAAQLRSTTKGLAAEHRLQARSHPPMDPVRQQLLNRSASLDPRAPGIWSELALADLRTENLTDAAANIARAFDRDPADLSAFEARAILAATQRCWHEAVYALGKIGDASPAILARAATYWPEDLQPPTSVVMNSRVASFFDCTHDAGQPCALSDAPFFQPRDSDRLGVSIEA